jgi:hypothetical protein
MASSGRRARTDGARAAAWLALATAAAAAAWSCGGGAGTAAGGASPAASASTAETIGASNASLPPYEFALDSLDERPVSSQATGGRPTLLCFITTGDGWSQAQVNYLVQMAKHDGDQINYWLVALEPRQSRELVEIYRNDLGVTFPTALGDAETTASMFGLAKVPTTILLDRTNRPVWRADGRVARSDEIRGAMRALSLSAPR